MIQCPNCNATLPDWQTKCQFCQADTTKVSRPVAAPKQAYRPFEVPKWIWVAYYAIATWWVVNGVWGVINGILELQAANNPANETSTLGNPHSAVSAYIMFIVAAINIVSGGGLLLKIESIRNIVAWIAGLNILFGVLGVATTIMAMGVLGAFGLLMLFFDLVQLFTSALLIYVIGETEKGI